MSRVPASSKVLSTCNFYSAEDSDQRQNISVQNKNSLCGKTKTSGGYDLRIAALRSVRASSRLLSWSLLETHVVLTSDTRAPCNRNLQASGFWKTRRSQLLDPQIGIVKAVRNKKWSQRDFLSHSLNPYSMQFQKDLEPIFQWLLIC